MKTTQKLHNPVYQLFIILSDNRSFLRRWSLSVIILLLSVFSAEAGDTVKITQKDARRLLSPVRTNEVIYTFTQCFNKDVPTNDCRGWIKFPEENIADVVYADKGIQNEGALQNCAYLLNIDGKKLTLVGEWKPKLYKSNQKTLIILDYDLNENLEPTSLSITISTGKRKMISLVGIESKESRSGIKEFIKTTTDYQASGFVFIEAKETDSITLAKKKAEEQKQVYFDSLNYVRKKAEEDRLNRKRISDSIDQVKLRQSDSAKAVNKRITDSIRISNQRTADSINAVKKREADSIRIINQRKADSIKIVTKKHEDSARLSKQRIADSIRIGGEQKLRTTDSINAVKKRQADSIRIVNQRKADSIKIVTKKYEDSARLSKQRIADSIRIAGEQKLRTADSINAVKKRQADSLKIVNQKKADSIANAQKNKKPTLQIIRSENITDIDGFQYKTVRMGTQTWMAENLNVTRFRNGDPIMEAQTQEEWREADLEGIPAWCYYNGDAENAQQYGKLYNWHAVKDPRGLAPAKWHIPNLEEWTRMFTFVGGNQKAGTILKDTIGWHEKGNGTSLTGFAAKPSGSRDFSSNFKAIQRFGYWWINEEHGAETAWGVDMGFSYGNINFFAFRKGNGFAIRCVRN